MKDKPDIDGAAFPDDEPSDDFERVDGSNDCFAPPKEPCECYCLHCGRTFMSGAIWFQQVIGDPNFQGFWMCPTPNCGGAGFTFDIFPTDENHPANAGWFTFDEDEFSEDEDGIGADEDGSSAEWDPSEPAYEGQGDDIEGEEWKHGLPPGAEPPTTEETDWRRRAREEEEEEEKRYNMPDERPRVLDWTHRPDRHAPPALGGEFDEDDIPF